MKDTSHESNPPKPVAYDTQGRPLYLHPPTQETGRDTLVARTDSHVSSTESEHAGHNFDPRLRSQYANEPSIVHAKRDIEPEPFEISEEVRKKHEESKKKYPFLNLSEGEYVIVNIHRHPIGLLAPVAVTGFILILLLAILIAYPASGGPLGIAFSAIILPILCLMILVAIGGYITIWIYLQNQFFMTNESVIQEIQNGLFSRHEQTVSLGSIEDVSFIKHGVLESMFDFGMIRLSTEGDETTYRFSYVSHPKKQTAILNNAVEAFKNGRPVTEKVVQ